MASTGSEFSICLILSAETYKGQDWVKELRCAWKGSSQVKFYKPSNKGKVPWLGSAERDVDIGALVEANAEPEPVDCGYKPS